ncbi:MAG: DUF4147 domain-containing protein [Gemmatimonadota bacterium]
MLSTPADFLKSCFEAGIAAVLPERILTADRLEPTIGARPTALLAIGKAAAPMAAAIDASLTTLGRPPVARLVIGHGQPGEIMAGDHPVPGTASQRAADALGSWIRDLPIAVDVHVAVSGGTSALIAAPLPGVDADELHTVFARLLHAGLDITEMNLIRKRLTRWSGGRLAAALAPRRTIGWLISDVPGDDPSLIGSGPLSADSWSSAEITALLRRHELWTALGAPLQQVIAKETLKSNDRALAEVELHILASNADALAAAARHAASHGVRVHAVGTPLLGDAATTGTKLGAALIAAHHRAESSVILSPEIAELWLHGGECVVALPDDAPPGGRNQALALAAAHALAIGGGRNATTLLAAGTDGRDGTTDAAGAVVDGDTWERIRDAGRDPAADLARHDAHAALGAGGALWAPGPTGTNVMDVVLALRSRGGIPSVEG